MNDISSLHSKIKGAYGESKIVGDLISHGYAVFKEFGDNSKVDLIAMVGFTPIKIQVKCFSSKNGAVHVDGEKSGPGYKFRYNPEDIDIFAVYVYDRDQIIYISSKRVLEGKRGFSIRFDQPKNNQSTGVNWYVDYLLFQDALRDYTPSTLLG